MWGRILSTGSADDSVYVSVDGGPEDIWDTAQGLWSPNWQWTRVTGRQANGGTASHLNQNPRLFSLSAGNHVIRIRAREILTRVDRLFIADDASAVP
jgi:hypothetical protein